jgi:hypothetical protein
MKRKWLILIAATLMIISSVAIKPAMAYFTDTVSTEKKLELKIGDGKLIPMKDTVENMIKKVSISNTGEYPVMVRAKALNPDNIGVEMAASDGWHIGDPENGEDPKYYYYDAIVNPEESTNQLNLQISADETVTEGFNVIIIQEAAKVIYDTDGNAVGDWAAAISTQTTQEVR